ncbi:MAG TPA: hypothetical protein VFV39_02000, partial [Limnobacter sp.]|nr:hypothetical protein [Limnobacter sp.]
MATLVFYVNQGMFVAKGKSQELATYATSGRNDCTNQTICQSKKSIGPLPKFGAEAQKAVLTLVAELWGVNPP